MGGWEIRLYATIPTRMCRIGNMMSPINSNFVVPYRVNKNKNKNIVYGPTN